MNLDAQADPKFGRIFEIAEKAASSSPILENANDEELENIRKSMYVLEERMSSTLADSYNSSTFLDI